MPKGYPYGYGAAIKANSGTLHLSGSREVPGTYTINGPIVNPGVINDTIGRRWDFAITLNNDQYLVINPRLRTVRLNGGASRRNIMTGRWWMLQPGDNDFRLIGNGTLEGSTGLTITTQPARR